jgi:hypothetical protein
LDITAARALNLQNSTENARRDVRTQLTELGKLRKTRKEKATALKERLSSLLSELTHLLDPMDDLWVSFGFKKPGATPTPDVPQGLVAVLVGPTAASLKWEAAARAEHYRVWKKVIGVDEDLVAVGSPADLDFTLEELPSNATIEIAISAVSNGGESAKSSVTTLVTH